MFDLMLEPWIIGDMMTLGLIEEIEEEECNEEDNDEEVQDADF